MRTVCATAWRCAGLNEPLGRAAKCERAGKRGFWVREGELRVEEGVGLLILLFLRAPELRALGYTLIVACLILESITQGLRELNG